MQEAREAVAALFGAAANLAERAHPSGPGGATPAQASGAGGAPVGAALRAGWGSARVPAERARGLSNDGRLPWRGAHKHPDAAPALAM